MLGGNGRQAALDAADFKVRQTGFSALPTIEDTIKSGEQPRFQLRVAPYRASSGEETRKGFLSQSTGVILISCEAESKPI